MSAPVSFRLITSQLNASSPGGIRTLPKKEMRGISALDFTRYVPKEEMRSISALDFTGCGLREEMKSISALDFTGCVPKEEIRSISALDSPVRANLFFSVLSLHALICKSAVYSVNLNGS